MLLSCMRSNHPLSVAVVADTFVNCNVERKGKKTLILLHAIAAIAPPTFYPRHFSVFLFAPPSHTCFRGDGTKYFPPWVRLSRLTAIFRHGLDFSPGPQGKEARKAKAGLKELSLKVCQTLHLLSSVGRSLQPPPLPSPLYKQAHIWGVQTPYSQTLLCYKCSFPSLGPPFF